jgi:hypothetical protein
MGDEYDFFADPRNDAFAYNDLGASPSNADILSQINYDPSLLDSLKGILSGKSGTGAQLASLGGIGALLNSMGGGGSGGFAGYRGGIPKYTASRKQYAVPTDGQVINYRPSDAEIANYIARPGMTDAMVARNMNQFGITPERIAGITQAPVSQINSLYQGAMGPNMAARRPGSGGVTYFSPMTYTPQTAAPATVPATTPAETANASSANPTIVPTYAYGGIASLGGYSDGGQLLRGPGDGVSDDIPATIGDKQPARLADGEFVVPARIVSELGNGSTEAGARKLYAMMDRIKKARSKSMKNIAANSKADKHLPA